MNGMNRNCISSLENIIFCGSANSQTVPYPNITTFYPPNQNLIILLDSRFGCGFAGIYLSVAQGSKTTM